MYLKFGSKMPRYLETGETTRIYIDTANDADYDVTFYVDFYYSTDRRTWNKFAHENFGVKAGKSYSNWRTLVSFKMPSAKEVTLGLNWRAKKSVGGKIMPGVIDSGEDYHTIKRSTVAPPGEEVKCTKEEFRNSMVYTYRDKAIGWHDSYSPVLDVTSTVRQIYSNVTKATLTIYGSNLKEIRVKGPYDSMPKALTTKEILTNWGRDQEWERQYCPEDKKYYWVIYPCKIDIEPKIIEVYIGKHLVVDVEPKVVAPGEPVKITWYHKTNLRRTHFRIYVYLDDSLIKKYEFSQSWADGIKSESFTHPAPTTPGTHTVKVVLWRHEIPVKEERRVAEYNTIFEVRGGGKAVPKLEIVKNTTSTYFTINGRNVGPGEHSTQKDSYVRFKITVKNTGGALNDYWVAVYDIKTGQYLWSEGGRYIGAGDTKSHTGSIRVDRDMELKVVVGRGDRVGQNKDDEWGC